MADDVIALRAHHAERLRALHRRTVEALFEFGQALVEAKAALPHGAWTPFVVEDLGWNLSGAERLMAIVGHAALRDSANWPSLPESRSVLYQLSQMPEATVRSALANQVVTSETTLKDFERLRKEARGGMVQRSYWSPLHDEDPFAEVEPARTIRVHFLKEEDVAEFARVTGMLIHGHTTEQWWPPPLSASIVRVKVREPRKKKV
jgi:hypothetical protein